MGVGAKGAAPDFALDFPHPTTYLLSERSSMEAWMDDDPLDRLVDRLSAGPAYFFLFTGLAAMAVILIAWITE